MKLLAAVLLALAVPAQASAQALGQGQADDISMWRVLAAFVLCALLAVAGAFLLRSRPGLIRPFPLPFASAKRRRMQLVEMLRLGGGASLCIVTCDGEELLVSASAEEVKILRDIKRPAP